MNKAEKNNLKHLLTDQDLLKKLVVGIGEVSEISEVPQRQLRYWEQKGIIHSVKESDGTTTRRFNYLEIKKILLIKELLNEGFTLDAAAKKVAKRMELINTAFSQLIEKSK